ncbi:MAG: ROK family protein [Cyclobacteriaceae bacterium]
MIDKKLNLWGIDMGGTKIEGAVLKSPSDPEVLFRYRLPTESDKGYEHVMGQIEKVVLRMEEEMGYRPERLGIGTPGTLDPLTRTMKNCNSVVLNGKPLKKDLEQILSIELQMANDANCFALAEANMGIAREKFPDAEVVFGVIMGTGVGGGVVVRSKVINGLQGIGGEWGHNFLHQSGGPCYCGKTGCVETVLSGPALERYYKGESGAEKNLKEIYELHMAGKDAIAGKTMKRLVEFFGLALSVVVNILDPQVIVIGGGVGNIDLIYTEGVKELGKHVFNTRLETPVLKPKLGDSAGVFGAAFLTQ